MNAPPKFCWRSIGVYGSGDQSCEALREVLHCRNCEVFRAAARGMFARPSPAETQSASAAALSDGHTEHSTLAFRLGSHWLGLPTKMLAETATERPVRRIAHRTTGFLEGVVNVRGELHLCVSLAELLGMSKRDAPRGDAARLVLIRDSRDAVLAFRCEEVRGLQRYSVDAVQAPPETLVEPLKRCVEGLLPMGDHQLILLKDGPLVAALEEALFG